MWRFLVVFFFAATSAVQASMLPFRPRVTLLQWQERSKHLSDAPRARTETDPWKLVRGGASKTATGRRRNTSRLDFHWSIGGNDEQDNNQEVTESDLSLAIKAGTSAAMEALVLLGILAGAKKLSAQSIPLLSKPLWKGLPVLQWASFALVIFGSSAVKNVLDGGMSAASNQARQVNQVPGDPQWYESLQKPWFNPPSWLFPIMWVLVSKPTQLWAVSRLFRLPPTPSIMPALAVYCTHLALGDVWNQVFFEQQRIRLGTRVISVFYGGLLVSAELFGCLDETAGFLMLPTVGWVTVATALNWEIYRLNRDK